MISIIAAISKNRVIGNDGRLPWSLPADLAYFKKVTSGHPVIMGRKTFESLPKPLLGRENIIITKNKNYNFKAGLVLHSIAEANEFCVDKKAFVIGGSQIYRQFFPYTDRLYITFIDRIFNGDCFFPEIDPRIWRLISKIKGKRNEQNPYNYYFSIYEKSLDSSILSNNN